MINKKMALETIEKIIAGYEAPEEDEYIVIEKETIEKEWGWVFFYTSKKWYETNNIEFAVVGNAPFIVLRDTGEVLETGTAYDAEHYIERYEETGDPHG